MKFPKFRRSTPEPSVEVVDYKEFRVVAYRFADGHTTRSNGWITIHALSTEMARSCAEREIEAAAERRGIEALFTIQVFEGPFDRKQWRTYSKGEAIRFTEKAEAAA